MEKTRVYKIFEITDKGILKLFTGTNFKTEGLAWIHAVEAKTDKELTVLTCYINSKDV
jgi:hypothetical protein